MIGHLRDTGNINERKIRLFAIACCRRLCDSIPKGACRDTIDVSERYINGLATKEELKKQYDIIDSLYEREEIEQSSDSYSYALSLARWAARQDRGMAEMGQRIVHYAMLLKPDIEAIFYADLLRDIFGPDPGNPPKIVPQLLTWNDGTILRMAERINKEGTWKLMPILADALEEAGCADPRILDHCRNCTRYVRGDWVVDAILHPRMEMNQSIGR